MLTGILTGFVGRMYNQLYRFVSNFVNRNEKKHLALEALVGSGIVALLAFLVNPELMGTSNQLIYQLTNDVENIRGNLPGNMNVILILLIFLMIKMAGNCITVGTGLSAGFTGPIIIVGMMIGVIMSTIAGIEYYTSEFYALICAGFTGMLASSMNIPVAAMILSVELFGFNYVIVGIISTIIAFKINDYNTLFDYD
jgi:CIC family chloride channel protein